MSKYWWGDEPRVMLPTAIFPQLVAGLPAARAFAALAMRADNHTGLVTSTYDQIAADAGMTRRRVTEGVAQLIELGWIEQVRKGRHHVASRYRVRAIPISSRVETSPTDVLSGPEIQTAEDPSSAETRTPETVKLSRVETSPAEGLSRVETDSAEPLRSVETSPAEGLSRVETDPLSCLSSSSLSSSASTSSLSARVRKALAEVAPDLTDDDEITALIARIERQHPGVRNLASWLLAVGKNGDLPALIDDMRRERTAGPQRPAEPFPTGSKRMDKMLAALAPDDPFRAQYAAAQAEARQQLVTPDWLALEGGQPA